MTESALGESGHGGNEDVIVQVAAGIVQIYAYMMQWSKDTKSLSAPGGWDEVFQAQSGLADMPIRSIRRFCADFELGSRDLVRAMRAGLPCESLNLTLKIDLGDAPVARLHAAMEKMKS
jgi:hypothetical protein